MTVARLLLSLMFAFAPSALMSASAGAISITNNFTVTNTSGSIASFVIPVSVPVVPAVGVNQIIQSTIQVSLLDDDRSGGATLTDDGGTPIYQGQVNGVTQLPLLTASQTLSCIDPIDCLTNGFTAEGVASQPLGPVLATGVGIVISFTLTPGDSANVLSRFEVIPEPATAALMAAGLAGLAAAGRRRRS